MLSILRRKRPASASPLRGQADAALIAKIHETRAALRSTDDRELQCRAEQLRDATLIRRDRFNEQTLQSAFALTAESIRRSLNIEPFDVQLQAGLALVRGEVAEMQTGEGKTIAAAFPALALSLAGRGVHVVTANAYLAQRDCAELRPIFERLGVSCGLIDSRLSPAEKTASYRCDITYGPGYEFGFDYLRDQVALHAAPESRPGEDFLRVLRGQPEPKHDTAQRGLPFAVIDEVDNVLIDDASSPLLLSGPGGDTAEDAVVHLAARDLASRLTPDIDYRVTASTGQVRLTQAGHARIWDDEATLPLKQLIRPWHVYVEQAVRARALYRRDVQYVVRDDKVCIVDESTGRIFDERVWRDGLHQAVEARENVPITAEKQTLATITRQRFYRLYTGLSGMTGTATGSESEFESFYRLSVTAIPTRRPCQRMILPTRFFGSAAAKWSAIAADIQTRHKNAQPVLVGTKSIAHSEVLAAKLESLGVSFELLNGKQDEDEAEIVSRAGASGAVTIATNMAGRGTDISPDETALNRGGLHVIAAEHHDSSRIDRQLVGRAARQGNPGSAQFFVSGDDELIVRHADWLRRQMQHSAGKGGELRLDLTRPVRKLQQQVERQSYLARRSLFHQDKYRDDVMAKLTGEQS